MEKAGKTGGSGKKCKGWVLDSKWIQGRKGADKPEVENVLETSRKRYINVYTCLALTNRTVGVCVGLCVVEKLDNGEMRWKER